MALWMVDGSTILVVTKRLRLHFARPAHQDLDAGFRFFQLLAARVAQLHSAFEQLQSALQGQIAALHFLYDSLQLLETGFETQRRLVGHRYIIGRARFIQRESAHSAARRAA
jgi:hypothetical protein